MSDRIVNITVNGAKVVNAQQSAKDFAYTPEWMNGINRVDNACGAEPGYGRFLVNRAHFDQFWPESGPFDIVFEWSGSGSITLRGYVTITASPATRAVGSAMVVTVADVRHLMHQRSTNRTWNTGFTFNDQWITVLNDLKADIDDPTFTASLYLPNVPSYLPINLRYQGWSTLDAIQDVANRTNHCLTYNPDSGSLQLHAMYGPQSSIGVLAAYDLLRPYDTPTTFNAEASGQYNIYFEWCGSAEIYTYTSGSGGDIRYGWGTTQKADGGFNQQDIENEAEALIETWQSWTQRRSQRITADYRGPVPIQCGSEVSRVAWYADNSSMFTMVDRWAPAPPNTRRQNTVLEHSRHYITPPETEAPQEVSDGGIPKCTLDQFTGIYTLGYAVCERMALDPEFGTLLPSGDFEVVFNSMPLDIAPDLLVNTHPECPKPIVIVEPCKKYDTGTGFDLGFDIGFG